MKTIFKTAALALLVSLASCKKDENNDGDNNNNSSSDLKTNIVGSWEVTAMDQKNGSVSMNGTQMGTFKGTGHDFDGDITFNSDGSADFDLGFLMDVEETALGMTDSYTDTMEMRVNTSYEVLSNQKVMLMMPLADLDTILPVEFKVNSYSNSTLDLTGNVDEVMSDAGFSIGYKVDYNVAMKKK